MSGAASSRGVPNVRDRRLRRPRARARVAERACRGDDGRAAAPRTRRRRDARDGPVTLGHRRLSIIDLSPAGHQPDGEPRRLAVADVQRRDLQLHRAARRAARARSRVPTPQSDTEVLLAAYDEWGVGMLDRLNGMFAFAIWDTSNIDGAARARPLRRQAAVLHDRSRTVSLRFGDQGTRSSTPPCHDARTTARVLEFLAYGLADHTRGDDVRRRPAAAARELSRRYGRTSPSLHRSAGTPCARRSGARSRSAPGSRALLDSAITLRLRSDVPVGVSLSGGMDSSSVLAVASSLRSAEGIEAPQSFSARSSDPTTDEHRYAAQRGRDDRFEERRGAAGVRRAHRRARLDRLAHGRAVPQPERLRPAEGRRAGAERGRRRPPRRAGRRRGSLRLPPLPLPPAPARSAAATDDSCASSRELVRAQAADRHLVAAVDEGRRATPCSALPSYERPAGLARPGRRGRRPARARRRASRRTRTTGSRSPRSRPTTTTPTGTR